MKRITFQRRPGCFVSQSYDVSNYFDTQRETVKLCAASATRIFRLKPGQPKINAVFTKRKPQCPKYFELVEAPHPYDFRRVNIRLKGYTGGFMGGVAQALVEMYGQGYRYVRLENGL